MAEDTGSEITKEELLSKLMKFCTYRERCQSEVRNKLASFNVSDALKDEILQTLEYENFLDEERFARIYVRSKFHQNKWGRMKIRRGLEEKEIDATLIQRAMDEIDPEEYNATLKNLLQKKAAETKFNSSYEQNHKLAQYAIRRGFEPELVWKEVSRHEGKGNDK